MTADHYNGWANYHTWNVALWLGNDEKLYHACRMFRRTCGGDITPQGVETFVTTLLPHGTPDFDSPADYRHVDWDEITNCIREM